MASTLRRIGFSLCIPLALALTGCGMNAQTLQRYTPAEGVNSAEGSVLVRNLIVVANGSGSGVVSASLITYSGDSLTAVSGVPHKSDGATGTPLTVTATGLPLTLAPNSLAILTNAPVRIAVSSPDLKPGQLVSLTLTFGKAAPVTLVAPTVSAEEPEYKAIKVG